MAGLREYGDKRDFTRTAEPEGATDTSHHGPRGGLLCVQKHAARRLHWDLRLELDGVLKSWAVPKGPSYDTRVRRLAVQVEDHPIEYGDFEGTIPNGEYGGGTVMLWDAGTWEPVGEPHQGLEKGELKVRLSGEKLRGGWVLVRTRGAEDDTAQWLLIKERDEEARPGEPDPWGPDDRSVSSGRTMDEIAAGAKPKRRGGPEAAAVWHSREAGEDDRGDVKARLRRAAAGYAPANGGGAKRSSSSLPATVPLSFATLVAEPPDGDCWLHEVKYDGYRISARVDSSDVRLLSRNDNDWTQRFARIAAALARADLTGAWLDGEMVVFDRQGVSDFHTLQTSIKTRSADVIYVVFDLLFEDGEDLRRLPLLERKARLQRMLSARNEALDGLIRYGDHIEGGGSEVFAAACGSSLEGVVSKRAGDPYAGRRTKSWLKAKCSHRQELVVGGYTEPGGSRVGLGALLLGVYEGDALRFAGRVGSGFDDATLKRLTARLAQLERAEPSFVDPPRGAAARGVHWVRPELVAEVAFAEWTSDGQLRQPVFKGLREDKAAPDVVREEPGAFAGDPPAAKRGRGAANGGAATASVPARASGATAGTAVEVGGVKLTHPGRVVFPDVGLTKLEVARYYEAVADLIVPYLTQRPLTVIRCPDNVEECFFQKHVTPSVPKSVSRAKVRGADGGTDVYPVVDTAEALLAMVQNNAVELHVWGSRTETLEQPDVLVFDLDPGPEVGWRQVREAARELRRELAGRGFESFLKTSGGKGLHIVVPVRPGPEWPRAGAWVREVVEALVRREPARYTATMSKAKRGGKVFVDHFRNGRGATSAAPYSLRARAGAPVSLPIAWDELTRTGGGEWTLERVLRLLGRRRADPWEDFLQVGDRQQVPEE